jgi:cell division protein ZapD
MRIDSSLELIPEISGNRLIVMIRLMRQDEAERLHPITDDADFELTLCS